MMGSSEAGWWMMNKASARITTMCRMRLTVSGGLRSICSCSCSRNQSPGDVIVAAGLAPGGGPGATTRRVARVSPEKTISDGEWCGEATGGVGSDTRPGGGRNAGCDGRGCGWSGDPPGGLRGGGGGWNDIVTLRVRTSPRCEPAIERILVPPEDGEHRVEPLERYPVDGLLVGVRVAVGDEQPIEELEQLPRHPQAP